MRTVAVTGVSGSVGRLVLEQLIADPGIDAVVGLDRTPPGEVQAKVRFIQCDLRDADLKPLLEGVDAVVHLAWEPQPRPTERGGRGSVAATGAVLDAASAAGVQHLVFVSSATVYGAWPGNPVPLSEDIALRPNGTLPMAVEKAEAERLVAEWKEAHPGVTAAVLRPTVTVGHHQATPLGLALAGIGLRPQESARPMQFVHRDDVASAVVLALKARLDGPFNVAPDGWIPDETVRALAGGPARIALPARLTRPLLRMARLVGLGRAWPGTEPYASHPWVIANDRLKAAGWLPRHTNEEAFVDSGAGSKWAGLNPRRRQEAALVGVGLAFTVALAGAIAVIRRSRSGGA